MALWVTFKKIIKSTEAEIETMKSRIASFVPQIRGSSKAYPAERLNDKTGALEIGEYIVAYIEQDRRAVNNELLTHLLWEKQEAGLLTAMDYMKEVADDEKIASLIENGTITQDELKACLSGGVTNYTQCEWKPKK
jgi:methyltransferase-like protein